MYGLTVASSNTKILVLLNKALAKQINCFCPTLRLSPPSEISWHLMINNLCFISIISKEYGRKSSNFVKIEESFESLIGIHYSTYVRTLSDNSIVNNNIISKMAANQSTGRGGFGEVYHVRHMIEGEEYAVKIVKFLDIYGDHERQGILKEVQNLVKLRSDFVVNYRNSWREDNHLFIQMDYYKQNLQTIIDNKHIVFERQTGEPMKIFEYFISCEILRELVESVKYLHDSCPPVIHRDLKPSNVLISQNSKNTRFIRLCDLGLATTHSMTSMSHTSNVGTAQYMAPEIFQPRYTIKVDIYSLAVIAFHLFDLFNM
ncbi:unnamed protein product [Medioppia subpectinata]|uniref:Protein kinase domain-containing protein n=1 Tax=Medioppia subpectinata TaxID=1979941 RepID=A0A7R9KZF9_9ACAR|nr:unnamed protein product [Medioppia subpectinata]CAG2112300.1 unnamed protein product [Medioppia subpectinata]